VRCTLDRVAEGVIESMQDLGLSWRSWRQVFGRQGDDGRAKAPVGARGVGQPGVIDCAVYVHGRRVPHTGDYDEALAQAHALDGFVWLGLLEPTAGEMADVARVFGLHELAAEDALVANHRAKAETFGEVTFMVLRTAGYVEHTELNDQSEVVETGVIMVFVGPRFVITVRHGAPGALSQVRAELEAHAERLGSGPWAVAHAVTDRLVDVYLDVSTQIEADIDAVEEAAFGRRASANITDIYQFKRELMEFKRAVVPLQRPLAAILNKKDLVPEPLHSYFRDVYENLARVTDRIANFDDLLGSVLQARLAQVTVDQNNDMRKIASWGAIAAVQTAIAGIYGMNFDMMPGLHSEDGFLIIIAVMSISAVVLYRLFRRSGWL
jgi:magnesium transporter